MAPRLVLQALLEAIAPPIKVYFQPPANVQMTFPAIVYKRDSEVTVYADNSPYRRTKRYQVTVIDRNPDSDIPDKVAQLPMCTRTRSYAANNLHHDVFTLYF